MQAKLERGKAAFSMRRVGLSVAILAGVATLSHMRPEARVGGLRGEPPRGRSRWRRRPAAFMPQQARLPRQAVAERNSLGCATGASAPALRGLTTAASGRVVETGAHAAHPMAHARTAATRTTNASAHLHAVRPPIAPERGRVERR